MISNNLSVLAAVSGCSRAATVLLLVALMSSCAHRDVNAPVNERVSDPIMPVDFGGWWERDYSRGGDINEGLTRLVRKMNRATPGSSANGQGNRSINSSAASLGPVIALARLADSITRTDTLEIIHDKSEIRVNREEDFALTCEFSNSTAQMLESALGTELCGWDGNKMVFHLSLPEGLRITHRFIVSPDKQQLNINTTVASNSSATPFTLSRFYTRFEPLPSRYKCTETLSRKKECWLTEPAP